MASHRSHLERYVSLVRIPQYVKTANLCVHPQLRHQFHKRFVFLNQSMVRRLEHFFCTQERGMRRRRRIGRTVQEEGWSGRHLFVRRRHGKQNKSICVQRKSIYPRFGRTPTVVVPMLDILPTIHWRRNRQQRKSCQQKDANGILRHPQYFWYRYQSDNTYRFTTLRRTTLPLTSQNFISFHAQVSLFFVTQLRAIHLCTTLGLARNACMLDGGLYTRKVRFAQVHKD